MQNSKDKIAIRLAQILMKFNNGERFSLEELAKEFNVSIRTIRRDINERFAYLPIKKEGDYYLLEEYALGKLSFDDIRNFATISGAKNLFPKMDNEFLSDMLNAKINKNLIVNTMYNQIITNKSTEFENINIAILKSKKLIFTYKNKQRIAQPYKVINNNGIWYLLAVENNKLKHFALLKISSLKISKDSFKIDTQILAKIKQNKTKWLSHHSLEVTLQIDNHIKEYFTRRKLLHNQTIIEEKEEFFILKTTVSYEAELISFVQYWIPYIKIISPKKLQEKLLQNLNIYFESFDTTCPSV